MNHSTKKKRITKLKLIYKRAEMNGIIVIDNEVVFIS